MPSLHDKAHCLICPLTSSLLAHKTLTMVSFQLKQRKRTITVYSLVLGVSKVWHALIKTDALMRLPLFCQPTHGRLVTEVNHYRLNHASSEETAAQVYTRIWGRSTQALSGHFVIHHKSFVTFLSARVMSGLAGKHLR